MILKNNKILNYEDPIYALKAIKGKQKLIIYKKAHIFDGASLTKYLFWVKKNFHKKNITEISASKKLLNFRKEIINLSF